MADWQVTNVSHQIHNWHFVAMSSSVNEPPYWIPEIQHVSRYDLIENTDIPYIWNNFLLDFILNSGLQAALYFLYFL
jgi:hypothetical protein